ncbi:SRPBCC family protein [Nocardia farcinica]|uniref:SRPBCC family protein n=1 Tax=Nocardia farcinica TaxID=37329 RepID=UPI0024575F6C|nr:SRPBCC family protein [Nocardia farcinica]
MEATHSPAYRLARTGQVDLDAPAVAAGTIDIAAPRARVWQTLADVRKWPDIRGDISHVATTGPAATARSFTWHADGAPVVSTFAVVEPPTRLTWTTHDADHAGFSAIAVYEFDEIDAGHTRIRCQESMDATAIGLPLDNETLTGLIQSWLAGLKSLIEQRGATEPDSGSAEYGVQ